ncbi:MAG: AAA family ATPase [Bacteroides sp.]
MMSPIEKMKLIPYGMTDFASIIRNNYCYIDKTRYIAEIERTVRFFFIVRPRRFGKSLFLNMLEYYYDCLAKDEFDELFGGLYVGTHPTSIRNSYLVLKMSFSGITANPEKMESSFNCYCGMMLKDFALKYASFLSEDTLSAIQQADTAANKLAALCLALKQKGLKMYLILDEYDNFANNVLSSYGDSRYHALTHGDGFLRDFLKVVKDHTDKVIERMYITGVSPVTMDDLTSGFNIASNQSTNPVFNGMIGFTEMEVRSILDYYIGQGRITHSADQLIELMKPWYDNYCFSKACLEEAPMYNSDMVLYFVNSYLSRKMPPEQMLDSNVRTDYNKLRHLIRMDKSFGKNASVIQEIITQGGTFGTIKDSFPAVEIAKTDNFKSLLFYYGMLSINHVEMGDLFLAIPNLVVKEQLYGYLADVYKDVASLELDVSDLNQLMKRMAYFLEWENYFQYIANQLKAQSSIREFMEGEAHVKGFLLSYMGMNNYYMTFPEYEMNKGFSDFYLQPNLAQLPDLPYSYAIEVKYAHRDANDSELEKLLEDARVQLTRYAECPKVQAGKGTTQVIKIALVFRGWDLEKFVRI